MGGGNCVMMVRQIWLFGPKPRTAGRFSCWFTVSLPASLTLGYYRRVVLGKTRSRMSISY